jgi:hypothetical protein
MCSLPPRPARPSLELGGKGASVVESVGVVERSGAVREDQIDELPLALGGVMTP